MATNSSRDVKMTLSVEALGEEDVKKIQSAIRALAKEGGDAAPEFEKLADEIGRIGEQAAALQTFTQLSEQTAALAQRQEQASTTAAELRTRLESLSATTQEAAERQRAVVTALTEAQQAARANRDALATLSATTDSAGKAEAAYTNEVQRLKLAKIEQRAEIERLSAALTRAKAETQAAGAAEKQLADSYRRTSAEAERAGQALAKNAADVRGAADAALELGVTTDNIAVAQSELVQALNRTGRAAEGLQQDIERLAARERELAGIRAFEEQYAAASRLQETAEYARLFDEAIRRLAVSERALQEQSNAQQWQREAEALVNATHAAQELARQTAILGAAQAELAAQRAFEKQAEDAQKLTQAAGYVRFWREELGKAEDQARRTAEEARLSAERISSAFGTLGVRSAQELQIEIAQVRAAMETVRTTVGLTGGALNTAFAAGNARIKELERELRQVSGTLTTADRAASLFKNSLGQIAAGNIIADGVGYLVNKVKELGIAFITTITRTEQLRRSLNAIYKDTSIAAAQFDFLKNTANLAGIAVQDIQQAFVKFSAATKASGISLADTNQLFAEVTRAASTLGLSGEQVTGMLEALGQMASKGTVSMEELRQQLGDRLPGALSLVAKGLGLTEGALIKLVESGGLAARDLFPALTKALGEMRGETDGLIPTYQRFKNVLTEIAQGAGDAGWTVLLTGALKILGGVVGAVALGLSVLTEVLFLTGKAAGALLATLAGNTEAFKFFGEEVEKSAERLAKQAETFNNMLQPAKDVAVAVGGNAKAMADLGAAAATASIALGTTTKAQEAQAFAAKLAADGTVDLSSKLVQLKAFIDELLSAQEKQIEASGKLAKAAKIEGDALVDLAELRGREFEVLGAQATAAEKYQAALEKLAAAQRAETELLVLKRDEIVRTAIAQDGSTKARQQEIAEIEKKIVASKAETEQSQQAAAAAEQETAKRRLAIQTYKDNAAAIGEFRNAMEAATRTLEAYEKLQKDGFATDEQVRGAKRALAEATRLYNDAVEDSIKAIDLETRAKQANINLTVTKLQLEQRNYESLGQAARAAGDYTMALHYEIEARRRQIEAIRLTTEAKRLEAEATLKALEIERAALDQSDPLLKQKQAEIDIRIANAKAKLLEANAGKDAIAALEREITLLRESGNVREGSRQGIDRDTGSRNKNADAIDRQTDALKKQKQNLTSDGLPTNRDGSAAGQFGNNLPVDQANSIIDKMDDGTLTANDLGAAQAAAEQAQRAKAWLDSLNQASVSFEAQRSAQALVNRTQSALQRVQSIVNFDKQGGADAPGGRTTDGYPQAPTDGGTPSRTGATHTVNINISGKSASVNVASAADANALTSVLRQLENAAGASS